LLFVLAIFRKPGLATGSLLRAKSPMDFLLNPYEFPSFVIACSPVALGLATPNGLLLVGTGKRGHENGVLIRVVGL